MGGGGTGGGGGGGGNATHHIRVTVKRATRKSLTHGGKLKVTIVSDRAATVKLRAFIKRGTKSSTAARKTVKLKKAGTRKTVLKLSSKARGKLSSSKNSTVQVSYRSGKESGLASSGR